MACRDGATVAAGIEVDMRRAGSVTVGYHRGQQKRIADHGCEHRYFAAVACPYLTCTDAEWCLVRYSDVYGCTFCGSDEGHDLACFQGCAEAGYRAKQDVLKTALCIDRARSIHKLIPVPGPAGNSPVGYRAEGRGGPGPETDSSQGV
jgi:hypothetical protein